MKRKRLLRLLLAVAAYALELEQILLQDPRLAAQVAAAALRMSKRWPMWRETIEELAGNHPHANK
jgi:hypothetical protein